MRIAILATVGAVAMALQASPAGAESIYRRGLFKLNLQGILMPEPKPNVDGPVVFRNFDLDTAQDLNGTKLIADGSMALNATKAIFSIGAGQPNQLIAVSEMDPPAYSRCVYLLGLKDPPRTMVPKKAPTDYVCVKTTDGRIARFRIYSWKATYQPDRFVDVAVFVETRVWNP